MKPLRLTLTSLLGGCRMPEQRVVFVASAAAFAAAVVVGGLGFGLGRRSAQKHGEKAKEGTAALATVLAGSYHLGPIVGSFTSIARSGEAGFVDGEGASARFNFPGGIAIDGEGNLVVADCGNHCIRKVSACGNVSTLVGCGCAGFIDGGLLEPMDVVIRSDGSLVVAECGFIDGGFLEPMDVVIRSDGSLVVAECGNHCIRKITVDGSVSRLAGSGDAGFADGDGEEAMLASRMEREKGIAVDNVGAMLVVDEGNHCTLKVTANGRVSTVAGNGFAGFVDGDGADGRFNLPADIAIDSDGNLFIADSGNHCVRKVSTHGRVSTLAGSGTAGFVDGLGAAARFKRPVSIAIDGDGSLVVGDDGNHCIRKVTADGSVSTLIVIGFEPCGIAVDLDGSIIVSGLHAICRIPVSLSPARPSQFTVDMLKMMRCTSLADVRFRVGNEDILAHRVVVTARSEYFANMLNSEFREGQSDASIPIAFARPAAFRSLLTYLYTNVLDVDDHVVAEVAQLADQYSLDQLFDLCVRYCARRIATKNTVSWLVQFDEYHLDGLRALAFEFVCRQLNNIKADAPETIKHLSGTRCHEVIMRMEVV